METKVERKKREAETKRQKLQIVQVAQVAQLHVLYDVLRVSHCLTPTHTAHTDRAPGHGA